MKDARLLNCALCHRQAIICSCCDRGNVYCGYACSEVARKTSIRVANKRYQNTYRGKLNHAAAQKRYVARLKIRTQKVTDHSSQRPSNILLIAMLLISAKNVADPQNYADIYCYFCGQPCSVFLRRDFLRINAQINVALNEKWPQGP
jgi:hypothetical protein